MHMLETVRGNYPVSFHAVGLSLGSSERVSDEYLQQLKALIDRVDPVRVSDHASWSRSGNAHLGDLLPLPYNDESLAVICRNIDITQGALGQRILIENPSTYFTFTDSTMSEPEFLARLADAPVVACFWVLLPAETCFDNLLVAPPGVFVCEQGFQYADRGVE